MTLTSGHFRSLPGGAAEWVPQDVPRRGRPVRITGDVQRDDRNAYFRDYMRKRRARKKAAGGATP